MSRNILLIIIITFFTSCDKIKYYPDKNFLEVKTAVLAHRAGGGGSSQYMENSFEAAKYGLQMADGLEVDLQISRDRTLWLGHSADLPDCGGVSYDCFPEVNDDDIVRLDTCLGSELNFSRLEEVYKYMSLHYPEKFISLDVKAWDPCAFTSMNVLGVMNVIADEINTLTVKYGLKNHVMVESETASFLNYVKRNYTGIECYLTSFGDFERAMQLCLESGFTGISFKYKFKEEIGEQHIQMIRRKGLKIQLWTIGSPEEYQEALLLNPDYIQADNLNILLQ